MNGQGKGTQEQPKKPRNLVQRGDGKTINVFRRPGQFFVCGFG